MVHWNNPFPVKSLEDECINAARVIEKYVNTPSDRDMIPDSLLRKCRGVAVITVAKAGLLVSGRIGSGVVVLRNSVTGWTAPSGISMFGFGLGMQLGGELTDFVFLLMDGASVEAFCRSGNIGIGANMAAAFGPYGRNAEVDMALFTGLVAYSKSKGLFGGVSLEGTILVRNEISNNEAYGDGASPRRILTENWPIPAAALPFHRALDKRLGNFDEFRAHVPYAAQQVPPTQQQQEQQQQVPPSVQQQQQQAVAEGGAETAGEEEEEEQQQQHGTIPPPPDLAQLTEHQPTAAGILPPGIATSESQLGAAGNKKVIVDTRGRMINLEEVEFSEPVPVERQVTVEHDGNVALPLPGSEVETPTRRIYVGEDGGLVFARHVPIFSEHTAAEDRHRTTEGVINEFIVGPYGFMRPEQPAALPSSSSSAQRFRSSSLSSASSASSSPVSQQSWQSSPAPPASGAAASSSSGPVTEVPTTVISEPEGGGGIKDVS